MTSVEKELTNVDWLTEAHKIPLICLGGSNRTLAKIARRREFQAANLPELHGYRLPSDKAFEIVGDLIDMDKKQRESVPGLAYSFQIMACEKEACLNIWKIKNNYLRKHANEA